MNDKKIKLLLEAFGLKVSVSEWKSFGHGHINDTYLIKTSSDYTPDYILQRKNHLIFKNIEGMMNNIMLATGHIRSKLILDGEDEIDRKVMTYLPAADQNYYVLDEDSNYWTICLYIRGSHGIEEVTNSNQAYSAGKAFGHFQFLLSDLQGSKLIETIPNFHNGKFRYKQLLQAIEENRAGRLESIKKETDALLARADEMTQLQDWLDNSELPLRTTHNDTKINNVLYDDRDNILCIIDLDTVMPGSSLFDFGDAIRTLGNTAPEDEPDLKKIGFHREYYTAFAEGYLSESGSFLVPKERNNLAYSCRYMAWEQAIRFLADYLNGDTYYKISYPEHNRVRTLAQLRYLEVLEENREYMESVTL
jgi:hypothetical protein